MHCLGSGVVPAYTFVVDTVGSAKMSQTEKSRMGTGTPDRRNNYRKA